jgi:hypothetical protein
VRFVPIVAKESTANFTASLALVELADVRASHGGSQCRFFRKLSQDTVDAKAWLNLTAPSEEGSDESLQRLCATAWNSRRVAFQHTIEIKAQFSQG